MKKKIFGLLMALTLSVCLAGCDTTGDRYSLSDKYNMAVETKEELVYEDARIENVSFIVPEGWSCEKQDNGAYLYKNDGGTQGFFAAYTAIDKSQTTVEKKIKKLLKNMRSNKEYMQYNCEINGVEGKHISFKNVINEYHDAYIIPVGEDGVFDLDFVSSSSTFLYADEYQEIVNSVSIGDPAEESESSLQ